MNKNSFFEYIATILKGILIAVAIVFSLLWIMQNNIYRNEAQKQVEEETIDYYLIGVLIDKNKYYESQDPTNYKINIQLGILYKIKKDYKQAEIEFKKAAAKAPLGEYEPIFKLVDLYIFKNELDEAETILNSLDERPSKHIIKEKASLYTKLGDKYYNAADYENAIPRYRKALFYYNTIKSKETKAVENSIASAYVYDAENEVAALNINDAINSLKMALTIVDAPIVKYKLAILLMKDDPALSEKYFDEVFEKEPTIINYDTYHRFLSELASESELAGDLAKANLYRYRAQKLTDYNNENILLVNDVKIENPKGKIKRSYWSGKYDVSLQFNLKNNSAHNINNLYLEVIFKDDDKIIDTYSEKIIDSKTILGTHAKGPTVNIKTEEPLTKWDEGPKQIKVEIYAAKTDTAYKLLLSEIVIVEKGKFSSKPNVFMQIYHKLVQLLHQL